MDKSYIISKLRIIFADIVYAEEDCEYDAPEFLTGKVIDFLEYRTVCNDSFLHVSAARNELEAAKLLIELGLDVNTRGDFGQTALHRAAYSKHYEMYDFLVLNGAIETIECEFGNTPSSLRSFYSDS